ncbi:ankyrin repeat domain-containing protein SOWAHA-like [Puntigrus tetrazona]|uniref:ankyrin repeat domain-containing protein SOWAHA-like n=1 Tax=Puntigrus tetrazona TaxID=1606681 RepID=UPI001C898774|nr:ankyrin repeat domain-containing protein SOWAHA-like [Puntigrus tetrazona]
MALTQEAILKTLLEGKGKVRNSDLLSKFKEPLNCSDPAEKKQNRDLFKTFVNNIAVVKELEDGKYIVLKKVYNRLLEASSDEHAPKEDGSHPEEEQPTQNAEGKKSEPKALRRSSSKASDGGGELSPIEIALERSKNVDFKPKRSMQFTVPLKPDPANKPYALPLRAPQADSGRRYEKPNAESLGEELQSKSRTDGAGASPKLRRTSKTLKPADEPKESHHCPLDPVEHQWLVKSAAGQWNQVYGLLLKDGQLAEKKDFMSGFTALHWAVKSGNADMVCRIIDVSRNGDHGVDVNGKSNGGYTPLHIAAIHHQLSLIHLLVRKYGADGNIRDNCGKKPYHYLDKGVSRELRGLLKDPKAGQDEARLQVRDEYDARKYSIGQLLANPTGLKKKSKARNQIVSANDDGRERDEPVLHRMRLISDVFS